jgi:hypothetical protein
LIATLRIQIPLEENTSKSMSYISISSEIRCSIILYWLAINDMSDYEELFLPITLEMEDYNNNNNRRNN